MNRVATVIVQPADSGARSVAHAGVGCSGRGTPSIFAHQRWGLANYPHDMIRVIIMSRYDVIAPI